jgi:hypothetical protein
MGSINSKSSNKNYYSNIINSKNYNRFSSFSRSQSFLSSCTNHTDSNDIHYFDRKRRLCSKKKVLILGLDGVGKTDLFTRLIFHSKSRYKINSLPRPTIGKLTRRERR